ncbi:hypothetical protein KM925_25310 [Priestia megaterium]|uniref:hypothetical protein n=1 Tax=Priestia megaterium TaxID=1404 RepID=UPI001C23EAFF|nr:hypothetical protein [Priestia megaterium]MBU8589215.1 hypothetical protein [Priestia megaterium]
MIKKLALIFCLTFFVCSSSNALAETNKKEALQEGEAYKMLYEDTKDANAKILDNVYFSLAFAAGFILLFLGSNAWLASRSRKNEFEALQQENKVEILKMKNDFRGEMNKKFDSLKENYQQDLSKNISEQFEKFKEENIKMQSSLEQVKSEIGSIRYELNIIKGDLAIAQENFYTALSHYIRDAKSIWDSDKDVEGLRDFYDIALEQSLNKINDEILSRVHTIDIQQFNTISSLMKELPDQYSILVQKINETLNKLEKM